MSALGDLVQKESSPLIHNASMKSQSEYPHHHTQQPLFLSSSSKQHHHLQFPRPTSKERTKLDISSPIPIPVAAFAVGSMNLNAAENRDSSSGSTHRPSPSPPSSLRQHHLVEKQDAISLTKPQNYSYHSGNYLVEKQDSMSLPKSQNQDTSTSSTKSQNHNYQNGVSLNTRLDIFPHSQTTTTAITAVIPVRHVYIHEVGPRDGLQDVATIVPTLEKVDFIQALLNSGLQRVEITSFVNPKLIPQLADAADVVSKLTLITLQDRWPQQGTMRVTTESGKAPWTHANAKDTDVPTPLLQEKPLLSALVAHHKYFHQAFQAGVRHMAVILATTETFTKKNTNASKQEHLMNVMRILDLCKLHAIPIRAYVSCAFTCPYEGPVRISEVVELAKKLSDAGCEEIAISDTTGQANPVQVSALVHHLSLHVPLYKIAVHLHDTNKMGLLNILAAVQSGATIVDTAIGGLGGCPFAPGASGNVSTEDVVYMLQERGIDVGPIDLSSLVDVGNRICEKVGRKNESKYAQSLLEKKEDRNCADLII